LKLKQGNARGRQPKKAQQQMAKKNNQHKTQITRTKANKGPNTHSLKGQQFP